MKKNIENKARIRKININFDVLDEKINALKERIERHKIITVSLDKEG